MRARRAARHAGWEGGQPALRRPDLPPWRFTGSGAKVVEWPSRHRRHRLPLLLGGCPTEALGALLREIQGIRAARGTAEFRVACALWAIFAKILPMKL